NTFPKQQVCGGVQREAKEKGLKVNEVALRYALYKGRSGLLHLEKVVVSLREKQRPQEVSRVFPCRAVLGENSRSNQGVPYLGSVTHTECCSF
ncbi:hypothetical protein, partial [Escherichia coli]|uniref:hypothetical protein n=1 Tax=Escherichia coli TaxID=562 RepID=UPI001C573331